MNNNIIRYILTVLAFAAAVFIIWYFRSIVVYILISAIVSLIGHPLVRLVTRIRIGRFQAPRALGAAVTLVLFWIVIFTFFRLFIPLVAYEATEFSNIDVQKVSENLEEPLNKIQAWAGKLSPQAGNFDLKEYISEKIVTIVGISQVSNVFTFLAGTLGDIFIAFFSISFITFFFLKDDRLFVNGLLLLLPSRYTERVRNVLSSIKKLLMRYFIGIITEVLLVMILVAVGQMIVGLKFQHAVIIGLFAGILNVIPYIGPVIGTVFGIAIGVATNLHLDFYTELLPMIGFMAIVFIAVQVIDNVLFQPLIYSSSVNAHPLEIFLVIMIAGSFAGIKGMILAIPSYTVIRVIAKEFFNQFRVVKKLTENI
ncbi:MAG: AI-2E family transporter [Bacteroidetes bacterium]|nr:AI-2E family transporter [Bacteroidota bacterium]